MQLYLLAQHLQMSKSELANIMQHQAIAGIQKYSLANQTKQLLKLEAIKSQLDYIDAKY